MDQEEFARGISRRQILRRCGMGMAGVAAAHLFQSCGPDQGAISSKAGLKGSLELNPLAPRAPHFPARAKHVIHLFMNGGPSQVDTFDPKEALTKYDGQALPGDYIKTERKTGGAMRSPFNFKRYGKSGLPVSDIFANVAQSADDLCVIRSMHANVPNHEPSLMLMNTGDQLQPRPSVGAWVTYGLGTLNDNLPGFVALCPNGVPIVENVALARALYASAELDRPIPTEHFAAVAEIISYVLRLARGR
jgi:type III secretion system FlhB-like substrate exporter